MCSFAAAMLGPGSIGEFRTVGRRSTPGARLIAGGGAGADRREALAAWLAASTRITEEG